MFWNLYARGLHNWPSHCCFQILHGSLLVDRPKQVYKKSVITHRSYTNGLTLGTFISIDLEYSVSTTSKVPTSSHTIFPRNTIFVLRVHQNCIRVQLQYYSPSGRKRGICGSKCSLIKWFVVWLRAYCDYATYLCLSHCTFILFTRPLQHRTSIYACSWSGFLWNMNVFHLVRQSLIRAQQRSSVTCLFIEILSEWIASMNSLPALLEPIQWFALHQMWIGGRCPKGVGLWGSTCSDYILSLCVLLSCFLGFYIASWRILPLAFIRMAVGMFATLTLWFRRCRVSVSEMPLT